MVPLSVFCPFLGLAGLPFFYAVSQRSVRWAAGSGPTKCGITSPLSPAALGQGWPDGGRSRRRQLHHLPWANGVKGWNYQARLDTDYHYRRRGQGEVEGLPVTREFCPFCWQTQTFTPADWRCTVCGIKTPETLNPTLSLQLGIAIGEGVESQLGG